MPQTLEDTLPRMESAASAGAAQVAAPSPVARHVPYDKDILHDHSAELDRNVKGSARTSADRTRTRRPA